MASSTIGKATQTFVPLKEIRDGYAILKDGTMLALLICSSINFALKSPDEQGAILLQFQTLLNSLDFTVQIFIESRKFNIKPYLALLEEQKKQHVNDLLKIQIQEYIAFVKNFTESTNIMTKSFFVVIPYSASIIKNKGGWNIFKKKNTEEEARIALENYEQNRQQIEARISVVEQGLLRCGVRVVQLGTDEVTELYYKLFNPGETEKPKSTT